MTPEYVPPSGEGIKRRFGAGASGQQKRDAEDEQVSEKQRTLSEMRNALKGGGSEGPMKEPIDKKLLQRIFGQKLHEKPEVRDALEGLMKAIERDEGVREAFIKLQDAAAKHMSTDAGT
ncbi:MAG: hypothetical protein Q7T16_04165 [Candidatus Burarchaeum sp.]|nr:hypothetical protein [Candidatus Burarchaeum sp.]MDO8339825.1 hypothetical protein [Candidatus Burarchaeum sp.]